MVLKIPARLALAALVGAVSVLFTLSHGDRSRTVTPVPTKADEQTFLATVYSRDTLLSSICLSDGTPGGAIQEHEARNLSNDLVFANYRRGHFSVGMEGGQRGVIIDLGRRSQFGERWGFDEVVGNHHGFASIHRSGREFKIRAKQGFQTLTEASKLYDEDGSCHARVREDHVYLIRILGNEDEELVVKLLVLAHVPTTSVTIRWSIL